MNYQLKQKITWPIIKNLLNKLKKQDKIKENDVLLIVIFILSNHETNSVQINQLIEILLKICQKKESAITIDLSFIIDKLSEINCPSGINLSDLKNDLFDYIYSQNKTKFFFHLDF